MSVTRFLPERIEGRHVLIALLAFFSVMFIVNGLFVYYALDTFNGFDTADAYRKGLHYNARIAAEEAQTRRGWRPALRYDRSAARLLLEVHDARGAPVAGLAISGEIRRPVTDRADRTFEFHEVSPAVYTAALDLAPGQWVVMARLFERRAQGDPAYRLKQRLLVEAEK